MFQPTPRIMDESCCPLRREVLLGVLSAGFGLSRVVSAPADVIDMGTHLSINGWVVSKRELSGSFGG